MWKSREARATDTFYPDRIAMPTFPQRDSHTKEIRRKQQYVPAYSQERPGKHQNINGNKVEFEPENLVT